MRRSRACALAVLALAPAAAGQELRPPPRVLVVQDPRAPDDQQLLIARLLAALDRAEAGGRIAPERDLGRRVLDFHVSRDPRTGMRQMSPLPEAVREQGRMADIVVCVGVSSLLPFVQGPDLPEGVLLYTFGAPGLAHLPRANRLLPNLDRVRGGVSRDVGLEAIVRESARVLASPGPMGVVLSRSVPEPRVTPALKAARELGIELRVSWIDEGREVAAAARKLIDSGIRSFVFVADPIGTDSRTGRLAMEEVRLHCLRNGIAILGDGPNDPGGHFSVQPDGASAAARMVEMLLSDWQGKSESGRIEPSPSALVFVNRLAAARDRIPLRR